LEHIDYQPDFFIVGDEQTTKDESFLFIDISSRKKFRCNIDYLDEPLECLLNGVLEFEFYERYQSSDGIYNTDNLKKSEKITTKVPRKQLPKKK
jgi:hypothetical protein